MARARINALERLYRRRFPINSIYNPEQARELALLSAALNRQIGLLLDRQGKPRLVIVGTATSIYIPELPHLASGRLRGWRLLHTHLSPEGLSQEDLMDLLFLRLDSALALTVSPDGEPIQWQGGWILPASAPESLLAISGGRKEHSCWLGPLRPWHDTECDLQALTVDIEKRFSVETGLHDTERAFLVSVSTAPVQLQERNLDELAELATSAGLAVCGRMIQRLARPDPRHILGKGKLLDLEVQLLHANADLIIFDGELTPAQLHNLADISERRVVDRTQLILDIFAQRATTKAGKIQVELAQLAYAQSRLAGKRKALDRLAGGIGGRGPGESKLELDRRRSQTRMEQLKRELQKLRRQRELGRKKREHAKIPVAAFVGYTNAGKSTLLNTLTESQVLAENRLFATLDPVTRKLRFPKEREITLADTVGFIRNLPHELTEAFRATLEELQSADLLIHVADASQPELNGQIEAVDAILEELGLHGKSRLLLLNKADMLDIEAQEALQAARPGALLVSGKTGMGLQPFLHRLEQELFMGGLTGPAREEAANEN